MTDYLAQNQDEGTFTPERRFAGEGPIVTRGGETVAQGQNLAARTPVALNEDGYLVAWNPAAGAASAVLNFTGVGTANDTVTINGQAITLVAASAAIYEATIGGTATATAQAVKTIINAHPDVFGVTAAGAAASLTLTAIEPGIVGNSIAVSEAGTGTNFTGSVTALAGGSEETENKVYGVIIEACDATSAAKAGQAVYLEAPLNHDEMAWPNGPATYDLRKAAFYRSGSKINIGKLG